MIDVVKKLGPGLGVGFLLGLAAVWWVEPATAAGRVLLVVICMVVSGVIGGALEYRSGKSNPTTKRSEAADDNQETG
jgi:hypothetical protein